MKPVVLLTDVFLWAVVLAAAGYVWYLRRDPQLLVNWRLALRRRTAAVSAVLLGAFLLVALLDSVHYRPLLAADAAGQRAWSNDTRSLLDALLLPVAQARERTYSAPLAWQGFRKETFERDGQTVRDYPRLKFAGAHLDEPATQWLPDVIRRIVYGIAGGGSAALLVIFGVTYWVSRIEFLDGASTWRMIRQGETGYPVRAVLVTASLLLLLIGVTVSLSTGYHVLGTDRVGNSVLVIAVKSIRTALVIGVLTTLVVLPLAVGLGVAAGYFRGWLDELIQYLYTMLASVPDVLLIAASVLLLQAYVDANPGLFETALERADARLFFLCVILGITSFTGLCRLVRGEAMKLRELEYIQAAQAFGVPAVRILRRHVLPNIVPIVLISTVMQFSGFVLAEAVLSYVGVGVDPNTASFGVLINSARTELSASPVIWWSLAAAFVFMLVIVLSANLFADAVRDAFDPRTRLR